MSIDSELEIGAPLPEDDEAVWLTLSRALHFSAGSMADWMGRLGRENFVVVRRGGRIVAAAALAPMGIWLGGRRIPLIGVNGVGVAPEARGSGVGSALMRAVLERTHTAGAPLSALYPATLPFYQRLGYERAGWRLTYELPIAAIDLRDTTLDLDPITEGEYHAVYHAYETRARRSAGLLDRPAWMWRQRLEPAGQQPFRFLIRRGAEVEGYVVYTQAGRADPLTVLDVCALTPAAGRRILTLFAGYRSMVEQLLWIGGPLDPLRFLLGENLAAGTRPLARIARSLEWMLRIVDLAGALQARGYPAGLRAELHLDVRDAPLPHNQRRVVLAVADTAGTVHPGGAGRIRLGIRELAAIYTGYLTPADLLAIGAIDGPEADLQLLQAAFAGPLPWMAETF